MDTPKRHRYGISGPRQKDNGLTKAIMSFDNGSSSMKFGFAQNAKGQQAFALKSSAKGHSFELGFANVDKGKGKGKGNQLMMKMGGQGGSQFGLAMNFGNNGKSSSKGSKEFSPMGKPGGPGISMSIKMGGQSGMKMKMNFGGEGNRMSMKFGGGKGGSGFGMSFSSQGGKTAMSFSTAASQKTSANLIKSPVNKIGTGK